LARIGTCRAAGRTDPPPGIRPPARQSAPGHNVHLAAMGPLGLWRELRSPYRAAYSCCRTRDRREPVRLRRPPEDANGARGRPAMTDPSLAPYLRRWHLTPDG